MSRYIPCAKHDVPDGVRFDVPRRNQGQTIEVAFGGFCRAEHDDGDPYRRIVDRATGPEPDAVRYYKLVSGE